MYDGTEKLTIDDTTLLGRCLTALTWSQKENLYQASSWPVAVSITPKENENALKNLIATSNAWYLEQGVDLKRETGQSHWDGTAAGREAHQAMNSSEYARCCRHQQAACEKAATGALKKYHKIASGNVQLTAPMKDAVFSFVTDGWLRKLVEEGQMGTVDHSQQYVLDFDERTQMWDAPWRAPVNLTLRADRIEDRGRRRYPPGLTPMNVGQSIESFWDCIKEVCLGM